MRSKKVLLICGSMNQTTMMHQIAKCLYEYDCYFTHFQGDGAIDFLAQRGYLDFSILGRQFRRQTEDYCDEHGLQYVGTADGDYDLVVTCSDLIVQKPIRKHKIVLVQEGMTDPENLMYYIVKWLKLPRYLASTSTTGLSHAYDIFCVASEGYADHFVNKGVKREKIRVTGIPNFDNAQQYLDNNFPYRNYVLAATSDTRETFKYDNRKKFIREVLDIADGRQVIFKLHPNEDSIRKIREIKAIAPNALIFPNGNTNHMIANCDVLVTQYSSVVYVGLSLGKECYSYFDIKELKRLTPIQNAGTSNLNIAAVCRQVLEGDDTLHHSYAYASIPAR